MLSQLLVEKNVSQTQLAEYLGVKRQAVNNYCLGKSTTNFDGLIKIAEFFNVSIDYLLTGKKNENKREGGDET